MLKIRCPKHPRYNGLISPRASCEPCMKLYRIRLECLVNRIEIVDKDRPKENVNGG